jgi:hypothetical protein
MAAECPNRKKNLQFCNCTYGGCEKKGLCCECIRSHRMTGELPACFFGQADEAAYDRSIVGFVRSHS